jgi:hypothetical protein
MRLGVMLRQAGVDQKTHSAILALNTALDTGQLEDAALFHEGPGLPCLRPRLAMMNWSEAYSFGGAMVATCILSASALIGMPGPPAKGFLVWDLEWMRGPAPFRALQPIYGCPWLRLMARSASHARAIEGAWGRPAAVVGDFDVSMVRTALG